MYYLYTIKSLNKRWVYIGCTDNLKRRFAEHNKGLVSSTKHHKPFKLVYYEAYDQKSDARAREYKLKNHSQTRELLYKQIDRSLNMALSSNG